MNVEALIAAISKQTPQALADMRARALRMRETGTEPQKTAAVRLLAALDEDQVVRDAEAAASARRLYQRFKGAPLQRRVIEAFRANPMTDNERKTIQALLDHPGSTTTELSRACGHDSMIWQLHFGNLCKERQAYLWPAEVAHQRDRLAFSGILADIDAHNRFTMKADVAAALAEFGMKRTIA